MGKSKEIFRKIREEEIHNDNDSEYMHYRYMEYLKNEETIEETNKS